MSLDSNYMIAPSLEMYFVNKDTGLPLSNGTVYFYSDVSRTTPKAVYTLSGAAPNYSYVELPNPVTLSGVGTFQDNDGNNVIPYYFPYDDNGNVELYYIAVFAEGDGPDGETQFTREAWPNLVVAQTNAETDLVNYIPNGQFLAHTDLPGDDSVFPLVPAGRVTQPITEIAQGGWTFERPEGSNSTDNVTFYKYESSPSNPTGNPRWAVDIECAGADATDTFKNLAIKWTDVNKFSSDTQQYTFSFNGISLGTAFDVTLNLIKNFGTDGAATTTTQLTTFTIGTSAQQQEFAFEFGANNSLIGPDGDDYVQLAITFPTTFSFEARFTDFILTLGNVVIASFPPTTNADTLTRGVAGWMPTPNPDGSDLYLPLVLTRNGMTFDDSQVGKIYADTTDAVNPGELAMTGFTLKTSGYSDEGIPYSRLFNKWLNLSTGIPKFGTGTTYATAYINSGGTNFLTFMTNQPGAQTIPANGAVATPFTFSSICPGASSYGFTPYFSGHSGNNALLVRCNSIGVVSGDIDSGQASITTELLRAGQAATGFGNEGYNGGVKQWVYIVINTVPVAGDYFNLARPGAQDFVWYKVNGAGTAPAISGNPIPVNLISGMNTSDVAKSTFAAINAATASNITTTVGSSITPNSYFTFHANGQLYVVWYSLNGTGTQPSVANAIYIPVYYTNSLTQDEVSETTLDAINSQYFYVPNLSGLFLRGSDPNQIWDIDAFSHMSQNAQNVGEKSGTIQIDSIISHFHNIELPEGSTGSKGLSDQQGPNTVETDYTGGDETRPVSMTVNWIVKY